MNVLDEIQQNTFRDFENLTKEFISPYRLIIYLKILIISRNQVNQNGKVRILNFNIWNCQLKKNPCDSVQNLEDNKSKETCLRN